MPKRTIAVGDVHGDFEALERLLGLLPPLEPTDTLVFLGDYVDRGPHSAKVVELLRHDLPQRTPAKVVALKGNHEDAWLRVVKSGGWPEFSIPPGNGCLACLRSFTGSTRQGEIADDEFLPMLEGKFLPPEVVEWFGSLPYWYEDSNAIYVHAGLPCVGPRWLHPVMVKDPAIMLWNRDRRFFTEYKGKRVVCGHTTTTTLPQELSHYTPECDNDLFQGDYVFAIDTGGGKPGGFLTAIELPTGKVYESRFKDGKQ
ncbi:MAG TPA: metallophosphoesterase [Myxococcales bacterium]|jgi:serine/threonine protein phosphatase 1